MNNGMKNSGTVFDIQRASLHDGPGIRTTVFLKGCPLHCLWCHNPEATDSQPQLFFAADKCMACGRCAEVCPQQAHSIENGVHQIDYSLCTACGKCVQVCNQQALKIVGTVMSVAEVMAEVTADRSFYEASGGGMTLSGGEPMTQFSFSLNLLKAAQEQAIHTCMETSGYAPRRKYEQILPYVDLFLVDYKISGSKEHKKYTGGASELILANLDFLYQAGKPVVLRCPIIPGVNDTHEHFCRIKDLSKNYPNLVGIEILPYHDMGNSKRTSIGRPATLTGIRSALPETAQDWVNKLSGLGCEKARIG
jgi:pyruvate formate lyase activating enzyme